MKTTLFSLLGAASILLLYSTNLQAQSNPNCDEAHSTSLFSVNKVAANLVGAGRLFFNPDSNKSIYEVPKGGGKSPLYISSIWIAGLDGSSPRTAGQRYSGGDDFWPGPIDSNGSSTSATCKLYDHHYFVSKEEIDRFLQTGIPSDNIRNWPGNRSNNTPLAPYVDVDGNGIYNPNKGDYPKIKGDAMTWWIYNDIGNVHGSFPNGALSTLGLEIQQSSYAFNTPYIGLDQTIFQEYKIRYTGKKILKDTYIGLFTDPDLGNHDDDYLGCSPKRYLAYVYNGDDDDEGPKGYGKVTPAIGVRILEGIEDKNKSNVRLSKFMYFTNSSPGAAQGDPFTPAGLYNYLRGRWNDGTPLTYGNTGLNTTSTDTADFAFPGADDPKGRESWSEALSKNRSGDRRMLSSMGPITLEPGAILDFTINFPFVQAGTSKESLDSLLALSDEQQAFFDSGFDMSKIDLLATFDKTTEQGIEGDTRVLKVRLNKVPVKDISLKLAVSTKKGTKEGDLLISNPNILFKKGAAPLQEISIQLSKGKVKGFDTIFYCHLTADKDSFKNLIISQGEMAIQVLKAPTAINSINGTNANGTAVKEGSTVVISGLLLGAFERKTANLTLVDSTGGIALVSPQKYAYTIPDLFGTKLRTRVWACGTVSQVNCLNVVNITKFVQLPDAPLVNSARPVTVLKDDDESDFVVFKNCSVVDSTEWKSILNGGSPIYATRFTNGKDTILVKYEGGTNAIPTPKKVDVYGLGYQYANPSEYTRNRMIRVPNRSYIVPNGTSAIQELKQLAESISIFPNPATDQLTIVCSEGELLNVTIFSIEGRKVWESNNIKNNTLPISLHQDLRKGLYLVVVNTSNVKHIVKKLVIE